MANTTLIQVLGAIACGELEARRQRGIVR